METGDLVCFKCINPAVGFIKRMAKDKSWADVQWYHSIDYHSISRVKTTNLIKLGGELLNLLVNREMTENVVNSSLEEAGAELYKREHNRLNGVSK